jgi:hypothetical protein
VFAAAAAAAAAAAVAAAAAAAAARQTFVKHNSNATCMSSSGCNG